MLFSRTLDEWMKCQRNWLYLEPVFTTADIQRQLPQESGLFNQVCYEMTCFINLDVFSSNNFVSCKTSKQM